nr:hypothetical protein [Mycobacterium haemophilum]
MVARQAGVGVLKLECPQSHSVGRILKETPHQAIQYDPGAAVGQAKLSELIADESESYTTATLPYL